MKRFCSVLLALMLLMTMLPLHAVVAQEQELIVNVKDFGAKGDGVASDSAAIKRAFDYAISNYASKSIPVTVYFPEGQYGLQYGGLYIDMPLGSGNLTVRGDGADKSTIVYLEDWRNWSGDTINGGSWVAIRIQLAGRATSKDDYMHDVTIRDMGVYDTDPVKHAWNTNKGDPGTEETHGFNIQHCVRATIKNCKIDSVGDEAIDMTHCIDSVMTDNLVLNSPGAGNSGGAISVGAGSRNVRIANNTVIGSIQNPEKTNWAIAVEALSEHIEDIVIEDNVIRDMGGWGVNIAAPGGTISDVVVRNHTITGCRDGGIRTMGGEQTNNVIITNNYVADTPIGIHVDGNNKDDTVIEYCTIENVSNAGVRVFSVDSDNTNIRNVIIRNAQDRAIYNAGTNTKIDHVLIDGVGLSGTANYAIQQYVPSGTTTSCSEVTNTVILNCKSKTALKNVQKAVNTLIEQDEIFGYVSIAGANVIQNCKVNRFVQAKNGATIEGLVLDTGADLGTYALYLNNMTATTVTNSVFVLPSRYAIYENGASDNNVVTNNVTIGGDGIRIVGANTVATGNAVGTVGTTEQYRYRIVDGKATIMEWLDKTAAAVTVPSTIDGCPVTSIEAWAFVLCANLTTITIPDSIVAIGANAFYMCDALTYVNYSGSEADWNAIAIGENNDALVGAARYNPAALYSDTVRHSVMDTDHGNGLAFRFELQANGIKTVGGNRVSLSNATVNYYGETVKLVGLGAVVTNDASVGADGLTLDVVNGRTILDVPTVYLQEVSADSCAFATRIIDIPDSALSRKVYVRPYYVVEVDGEQIAVYGAVDALSCSDVLSTMLSLDEHYMNNIQSALPQYQSKVGGGKLLTFTMLSDIHDMLPTFALAETWHTAITKNVEAASAWAQLVNNDFIMLSGDLICDYYDKEAALGIIDDVLDAAQTYAECPVYALKGNHDTNEGGTNKDVPEDRLTDEEFYLHANARSEKYGMVVDPDHPYNSYYYVDFPEQKIRMVCLNTSENKHNVDDIESVGKGEFRYCGPLSPTQLEWVKNTALRVDEGWAVMVVSHIAPIVAENFHNRGYNNTALRAVYEAFVAGTGDFAEQGAREFIGHFSGHAHIDAYNEVGGLNYVNVNCTTPEKRWDDSLNRNIYGDETTLSMNSFIVDRENRIVHCIKVGTGESFSFTW